MESKELSKSEEAILYKVVEEYQENGIAIRAYVPAELFAGLLQGEVEE